MCQAILQSENNDFFLYRFIISDGSDGLGLAPESAQVFTSNEALSVGPITYFPSEAAVFAPVFDERDGTFNVYTVITGVDTNFTTTFYPMTHSSAASDCLSSTTTFEEV